MSTLLGRDAILAALDLPTKEVKVPEWGGTVRIRSMTSIDRDDYQTKLLEAQNEGRSLPENVRAIIAARCMVDDSGKPLFTLDDVQALGEKSAVAIGRVYDAIIDMSKIGAGAIEDAAKNS